MFDGQAGLAECQKSRPGWDSDPQSLNGLIRHNRSPMRYAMLHRARRCARVCHLKVLLLVLCPSCSVRFASSVHRKERSSGLCPIDTHFKKSHSTVRVSCPTTRRQTETTVREAPLGFVPRTSCLRDRRFDQLSHSASLL